MNGTLKAGDVINNYEVTEYLKVTGKSYVESYYVTSPGGKRGLLKLFSTIGISSSMEYGLSKLLTSTNYAIAPVMDSGMVNRNGVYYHYLVREVVSGERLCDTMAHGKCMEGNEVLCLGRLILQALKRLHTMQPTVLHNNLSLRSVVTWRENGVQRVTLIGLNNLSLSSNRINRNVDISDMNPSYLAPEAMERKFSEQTDIFSVGVIMYRLLVGFDPWTMPNKKMTVASVKMLRRTYSNNCLAALDQQYQPFFRRMLAFDPKQRYATIDEALMGIEEIFNEKLQSIEETRKLAMDEGRRWRNNLKRKMEEERAKAEKEKSATVKLKTQSAKADAKGGVGLDRVAGLEDVKRVLRRNVMFVMQNPEKAERYGLRAPNGILLYGPPGCGKTFVAEMFAEESGLNYMMVKGSDLGSVYIHGTQEKIAELFGEARAKAPVVICLDELDGMVPDRAKVNSELASSEVNEFLCQLNNCSERGILVIGTTNRPEKIDPAVLRTGRMDKIIYVSMPNAEARTELFKLAIDNRYVDDSIDYAALAEATEGYVASDISYIVNEAALTAAIEDKPLTQTLILEQIAQTRSSVSKDDINEFEHMRARYESTNGHISTRRKIGYV